MNFKTISKIGILLCSIVLMSNLNAQEVNDVKKGILSFESEVLDYGIISQNENGLRAFKFTNTGNAPIVIVAVKTTCGCTVASKPDEPIQPGESAQIEVNYDAKKTGKFSKSVTVISNASIEEFTLKIKGEVIKKPSN